MDDRSAAPKGKHVEKHSLGRQTVVTDEAHVPDIDGARVPPRHPRARVVEGSPALQGPREVTARSARNDAEDRIRCGRTSAVEKAASDFAGGSVAAHRDDELEARGKR